MKTKAEETKADGIKLDRADEIQILNNHVIKVDVIRADGIQILNNHDVSPTADSRMNLKVVPDRDNAHPKIFKEPFKPPVRTIKMERLQHKQFNQLLTSISLLELLVKNLAITQFNSKMPISWPVSHKEEAFLTCHTMVFMNLVSRFVSTEDVTPHCTCTFVSITKTSLNALQSVT